MGLGSGALTRSDAKPLLLLLPDSRDVVGMNERVATWGYVVRRLRVVGSKPGMCSVRDLRWPLWDRRLSAAWHATRILSSPPSLRRVASSAISISSHRRCSCFPAPCSIISVRVVIFVVIEDMEAERTASSSRRSAKLRERSSGSASSVCEYSSIRASEYPTAYPALVLPRPGIVVGGRGEQCK